MSKDIQKEMLEAIEEALQARAFNQIEPKGLYEPIAYTLDLGGKRLRPLLCCLAAQLFTKEWQKALPIATALEVFHNFTLLHDDLMDHSPIRRGQETVYLKWSENTAILSGDVMSIEAYRALEDIADPAVLLKVFPLFNQMAIDICRGQEYDMSFEERDDVSVEEYIEMIRLKTAVLLGASLRMGAIVGGADEKTALAFDTLGQKLGLAFQIQDDYLDVYGDEQTFGKPIGGDIMNAKKTLLLLYAKENLATEDKQALDSLMNLPQEARKQRIEGVRKLYDKVDVAGYAKGEIIRLTDEARALLDLLKLNEELTAPIHQLFTKLISRLA